MAKLTTKASALGAKVAPRATRQAALGLNARRAQAYDTRFSGIQGRTTNNAAGALHQRKNVSSRQTLAGARVSESKAWQLKASSKNAIVAAAAEEPEERKIFGMSMISLGKFASLAFMFFCILFNYTILRDTKDVLVVTAPAAAPRSSPS